MAFEGKLPMRHSRTDQAVIVDIDLLIPHEHKLMQTTAAGRRSGRAPAAAN